MHISFQTEKFPEGISILQKFLILYLEIERLMTRVYEEKKRL